MRQLEWSLIICKMQRIMEIESPFRFCYSSWKVVALLFSLIDSSDSSIDKGSTILLADDTILSFLLKREQVCFTRIILVVSSCCRLCYAVQDLDVCQRQVGCGSPRNSELSYLTHPSICGITS